MGPNLFFFYCETNFLKLKPKKLRDEDCFRDEIKLQLDKWVASFSRSGVTQKMKHVCGHLVKVGTWRDGENYEPSLYDGEHRQLFTRDCYKKTKGRRPIINQSSTTTTMNKF